MKDILTTRRPDRLLWKSSQQLDFHIFTHLTFRCNVKLGIELIIAPGQRKSSTGCREQTVHLKGKRSTRANYKAMIRHIIWIQMNFSKKISAQHEAVYQNIVLVDPTDVIKVLKMTHMWSVKYHCLYVWNWKTDYLCGNFTFLTILKNATYLKS